MLGRNEELKSRPSMCHRSSDEIEMDESQFSRQTKNHKTHAASTSGKCSCEDDVRCGKIDADAKEQPPSLPHPQQKKKNVGNIRSVPDPLLLLSCEWLFAKDLLEIRKVNRTLHYISKDSLLWKRIALHLWNAALIDGYRANISTDDVSLHTSAPADLTLEDLCRCMVGAWPTQLDLDGSGRHPWLTSNALLQPIIDGVPLPFPLLDARRTQPEANESSSISGEKRVSSASGSSSSVGTSGQICSDVVFRGPLGGDRAVRANLPFPWMEELRLYDITSDRKDQRPASETKSATAGLPRGVHVLTTNRVAMAMDYPHTFLAHVKHGAPFATLWPGHSAVKDVKVRLRSGGGKDVGVAASNGPRGSVKEGDVPVSSPGEEENIQVLVERLPSSGAAAFFYAGYTAYYEITLGEQLHQLVQNVPWELPRDQCVAIGLATQHFPLVDKQPGWDSHSWGLHSDDGFLHHRGFFSSSNPTPFGPGDTVGCGLLYPPAFKAYLLSSLGRKDRRTAESAEQLGNGLRLTNKGAIFFTKNGRFLGIAFCDVNVQNPLYPCVGLDSHCTVEFNFGRHPFAFDVPAFEAYILRGREARNGSSQDASADIRAPHDHAAAIRNIYSGSQGLVNPRLLFPHLQLSLKENKESKAELNMSDVNVEASCSQSEILRRSLKRLKCTGLFPSVIGHPWPGEVDLDGDEEVFQYPDSSVYESGGDSEEEDGEMGDRDQNLMKERMDGWGEGNEETDGECHWKHQWSEDEEDEEDMRGWASVESKGESVSVSTEGEALNEERDDSEGSEGKYPREETGQREEKTSDHESIESSQEMG